MIETDRALRRKSERFLRDQIGDRRGLLLLGTACSIGVTAGHILFLYGLVAGVQAVVTATPETLSLGGWLLIGLVGLAIRLVFSYASEFIIARASQTVLSRLRQVLIGRLFDERGAAIERNPGATAGALLELVDRLEPYYARFYPQRFRAALIPTVLLLVIFPVNWVVALGLLLLAPLIPVSMALAGIGAERVSRRQIASLRYLSGYFLDRLQGLAVIRRLDAGEHELEGIAAISDDLRRRTIGVLRVAFLSSAALELLSAFAIALVAIYVGLSMLRIWTFGVGTHGLSLQSGLFLVMLAPAFFQPLRAFAAAYHDRADALAAARELLPLAAPPPVARALLPAPAARGELELRQVSVRYPGRDHPALDGVNLVIPAGALLAVLGPSGCGKTTLLGVIAGQIVPTGGEVLVAGGHLTAHDPIGWRRQISWVGQRPYLFPGSIADNIALGGPGVSEAEVQDAAERAGVTTYAKHLPAGLDTAVGERGTRLSAGEAQRVALARAFLKAPPLVILDEPTAHLDTDTAGEIIDTILRLAAGRTVVIATHSETLAARCRHIVRLEAGVIAELLYA